MLLKGCLHTHTTCSDGVLTPQQTADAYGDRGYDFIAFTDHDYLLKSKENPLLSKCYANKFSWLEGSSVGNWYLKFVSN